MYHNIPMELRELPQWVCWRYELVNDRKTKVPYAPDGLRKADVNNPGTWGTFLQATTTAAGVAMDGIGLVLTVGDPYTGIDIDDKVESPADETQRAMQVQVLERFHSYTERSVGERWYDASGAERGGYHIIIRGKIDGGRDREHIGVYSTARYLTFSGDVVRNAPITEYQQLLEALVAQMPGGDSVALEDVEAVLDDREVCEMAMRAINGEKYDNLCRGDWTAMGYTSQSEADYALLAILAFYTRDNEQVRRLFRMTALGKREKAQKDNRYLDINLRKIRAKEQPFTREESKAAVDRMIANSTPPAAPPEAPGAPAAPTAPPAPPVAIAGTVVPRAPARGVFVNPPGLVGKLAAYFHSTAHRPVQEVALAAAIGLMAGVVGRSYNVSGTGLNQYLLLIARTGTGKEGGPKGIESLLAAVRTSVPMVDEFIGPGAFASGQAMIRVLDSRPSFLSILGEFGLTLQQLNDPRAPAAMVMLKRVLLDLYAKSGWQNVLRSTAYSDSEKNTKTIHAPNVSFLGDATPETFYDGISSGDIADGLIPRLQIIEYKGLRPARNPNAGHPPEPALATEFADMVALALTTKHNNTCAAVQMDQEGQVLLNDFDEFCDEKMRHTHNSSETQLWNRAHLKALKLAALLAVGVNPHAPCITRELAVWAINFTQYGTEAILARFDAGDVGQGESKQASDLRRVIDEYYKMPVSELKAYKVDPELKKAGLVPYSYLQIRCTRLASFYKDRMGASRALKGALETAVQTEQLFAVAPADAAVKFKKRQALYYMGPGW